MKRLLLLGLALFACARDFSLPQVGVTAAVTGFKPDHAFAGDRLLVTGQAFDPVAARNLVHFARATAPGESFDPGGALVVHVPDDAGSAPLSVATPAGLGAPSAAGFTYRGFGHLRAGQSSTALRALHRPPGIVAAGGDLWIASTLFRAVQSRGGKFVHLDHKVAALVASADGSVMYAAEEDVGNHDVYRIDPANPSKAVGPVPVSTWSLRALAVSKDVLGNPQLWVAGDDGTSGYLAKFSGDTGLSLLEQRPLPLVRVLGVAANPDGSRVVLIGQRVLAGSPSPQTGALVVDTSSLATVPLWVASPAGRGLPTGAIANLGADMFVGLDDGIVADLSLGGAAPSFGKLYDTLSSTPVGALAVFSGGSPPATQLLVSKPDDQTVLALNLGGAGAIAWGVPVRGRPTAVAVDPAGTLFAADESANFVDAIAASNGQYLNRISFEAALGDPGGSSCGAAYDGFNISTGGHSAPRYLVVARNQFALVTVDAQSLQLGKPLDLVRGGASPAFCVAVAPDGSLWVLHQKEVGRIPLNGKKEVLFTSLKQLPVPPVNLRFLADGRALLQFPSEVKVVGADGQVLGGSSVSGNLDLLSASDTQVLAVWSSAGQKPLVPHAALWPLDAFIAGGAPSARFDDTSSNLGYAGAVALPDRTLLFFDSSTALGVPGTVPLDAALLPQPEQTAPVKSHRPIAVAPDRRYFLWTRLVLPDLVLHLTRGVPGSTIVNTADMPLPGPLQGAAFDPSGERLLVPVGSEDVIQVYE